MGEEGSIASQDELVSEGALRMLMAGLETEVADYVEHHLGSVDEACRLRWSPLVTEHWGSGQRWVTCSPTPSSGDVGYTTANILDALPKRLHRQAKAALQEIYQAETRVDADAGIDELVDTYGDKYPKSGRQARQEPRRVS
jgi:hypothetical protein